MERQEMQERVNLYIASRRDLLLNAHPQARVPQTFEEVIDAVGDAARASCRRADSHRRRIALAQAVGILRIVQAHLAGERGVLGGKHADA